MRYFVELAYNGANYFGWQIQPQQISVQATIEKAFSTLLNSEIKVTGCGRTDTGVHAQQYFLHFDTDKELHENFLSRLNKFLPKDIVIFRIFPVEAEAHARFDAYHRAYEYHIDLQKNPFRQKTAYYFPFWKHLEVEKSQAAAALLLDYQEFAPFCKANNDAKTMICDLRQAAWLIDEENQKMVFHIAANRFLRGMVRLIVGMSLRVGLGKMSMEEVREAMEKQERLSKTWSVPAEGLYLKDIRYPYIN